MTGRGRIFIAALLLALISGCAVGPDYVRPDALLPPKWDAVDIAKPSRADDYARWWKTFNDPLLDRLVREALESNLDIRLAKVRLLDARARLAIAYGAGLPDVNISGSLTRARSSSNVTGRTVESPSAAGAETDLYKAGFDAQWEIDVFGGVRRSVEAARANSDATVEDGRAVMVSLLGELARNYIELRGIQRQIAIAGENLRLEKETHELTKVRFNAGLVSGLDGARAEAQAAETASRIPAIESSVKRAIYRIGVLLGREPEALTAELSVPSAIPAAAREPLTGLPSELLLRRPDIRRAEKRLAAATAEIGVAEADLFPRFDLTAFLGLQSSRAPDFFTHGSRAWSVSPGITLPLLGRGSIRANIDARKAGREEAFLIYRSTVLSALEDVENSLNAYYSELKRREALKQEVEAGELAVSLSNERYIKGLSGFLDVLDAERSLYSARSRLSQSETNVSTNMVALYKALGGGWETSE
ncbi:MAG: efflux transporter outer membrane subunit [Deltaproteobacteria bacterium]|nr:efflux transporter outer membrane subunit [Deltaproteobacteria bacterium]